MDDQEEETETEEELEKGKEDGVEKEAEGEVTEGERSMDLVVHGKLYPAPLASHEEVVRDRALFMETLRSFHSTMRTKFMIPVIGGRDLDLHLLYQQVTQKSGIEKVIVEKRWREVIAVFNFPRTTTSASFVLRRYYLSLLFHYEQVYFFRVQGPLISPSAKLETKSPHTMTACRSRKRALPTAQTNRLQPVPFTVNGNGLAGAASGPLPPTHGSMPEPLAIPVTGKIDGKFDHGYFVSVNVGSQTLRGVLYQLSQAEASSSAASLNNALVPNATPTRVRNKQRRHRNRDPDHPKPNRSAYNFFFAEEHAKLRTLYPNRERDYSKMIGEAWGKLTEEERKVYNEHGRIDKERYLREKHEYKERLRLGQREDMKANVVTKAEPSQENAEG